MATIGDVARQAGVSTTLVSRYLNGVKGVSPASKEKIESAIRELQYVPDESARMLVRRRGGASTSQPSELAARGVLPKSVALVCEDADFQLVNALYAGAKRATWTDDECDGWQILLFSIGSGEFRDNDEDATMDYIRRTCKAVLGVKNETDTRNCAFHKKLRMLALPTVFMLPDSSADPVHRTGDAIKAVCACLERSAGDAVRRLCQTPTTAPGSAVEFILPCSFEVIDE